jgi:Holliday junction resolvase RusA-like endonuclease
VTITLVVPGPPVGFARTRLARTRTGRIIPFTPKKPRNHMAFIKALFVQKYPGFTPLDGPLEMEIVVFFPIPKSASKRRREDMFWQRELPTKKPDIDNLCKIFLDAMNGLAYRDDAQIVSLAVIKQYSTTPQTEVRVRNVGEEP